MSLLAQLHDLKLALDQFRPAEIAPDEEQRICHTAAKLVAMLDQVTSRTAAPAGDGADGECETLLSIARQYGVRVSDLRRHNLHLQHYDDTEPLPRNTPVKVKGSKGSTRNASRSRSIPEDTTTGAGSGHRQLKDSRIVYDTIRSIARDQNVTIEALVAANRVLQRFDVDEALPQDLDIVIPTNLPPAQKTYVLTFVGETLRAVAETVAHCRPEELLAANPQLGNIGFDTRLPEGTRIALPR